MSIIRNLGRLDLLETVHEYGFAKGAEVYWLFKFHNLPENQNFSRQRLEREVVELLKIPKCSKSTFEKTYALYNKLKPRLLNRNLKDKIEIME